MDTVECKKCPFELGEIVIFKSYFRFEYYIARIQQIHIDYWGSGMIPTIRKATPYQKQLFYESGKHEVVLCAFDYK